MGQDIIHDGIYLREANPLTGGYDLSLRCTTCDKDLGVLKVLPGVTEEDVRRIMEARWDQHINPPKEQESLPVHLL